jgi:hypothetical protein
MRTGARTNCSFGSAATNDPEIRRSVGAASGEIEQIKRRALRRGGQLSNIHPDDADSAHDQGSMEPAQKLAAQSMIRLAGLRDTAALPASP